MTAFSAAVNAGLEGLELDTRLTRDGVPVVLHDPHTSIFGGKRRAVARSHRHELQDEIPTLAEVLELVVPDLVVDVEIKPMAADPTPIFRLLDRPAVRISSFDLTILAKARAALPDVPRALLVERGMRLKVALSHAYKRHVEAIHLSMDQLKPRWIHTAHRDGLAVRSYTANKPGQWIRCVELGVDAVMTDHPLELEEWMRWHQFT